MKKFLVKLLLVVLAISMIFPLCVALTGCENEDKGDTPPNTDTENSGENDTENGGENNQTGEGNKTETPPPTEEKSYGTIKYFSDEGISDPLSGEERFSAELTKEQADALKTLIDGLEHLSLRVPEGTEELHHNGVFQFADSEEVYAFSYVNATLFFASPSRRYHNYLSLDNLAILTYVLGASGFTVPDEVTNVAQSKVDKGYVNITMPQRFNTTFTIITDNKSEMWRDTEYGTPVDYAVYMRNKAVEEQYGVELMVKELFCANIPKHVSDIIKANDQYAIDIVVSHALYSSEIAISGNAKDLFEISGLNLYSSWWNQNSITNLSLNGKLFSAVGAMNTSAITHTYCMFYNKSLLDEYKIPDMYELVMSGDWTYDRMLSYISSLRMDLNKDGRYTNSNLFGLGVCAIETPNYLWAFDNPIFTYDRENLNQKWSLMSSAKIYNIVINVVLLDARTDGVYSESDFSKLASMFENGQLAFINATVGTPAQYFGDISEDNYGICPYPKYNSSQANYHSGVNGGHSTIIVPTTSNAKKLEKIGVVTDALNRLSNGNNSVAGAVCDQSIGSKYFSNSKEHNMLNLILNSQTYDFGYVYLQFESPAFWIQEAVLARDMDISDKYKREREDLEKQLEKVYAAFGLTFEGLEY